MSHEWGPVCVCARPRLCARARVRGLRTLCMRACARAESFAPVERPVTRCTEMVARSSRTQAIALRCACTTRCVRGLDPLAVVGERRALPAVPVKVVVAAVVVADLI